jgi:hypothetical protein
MSAALSQSNQASSVHAKLGCTRVRCRRLFVVFSLILSNRYNDKVCSTWKEPDATEDITDAKRNLERWLFYFDRFNNHELSAKLDRQRMEQSTERIEEVQNETGMSWIEVGMVSPRRSQELMKSAGAVHATIRRRACEVSINTKVVLRYGVLSCARQ